jgi:hypothetical protein
MLGLYEHSDNPAADRLEAKRLRLACEPARRAADHVRFRESDWREQKIQVKRGSSSGANGSQAIPELHLLVSIDKKVIKLVDANQAKPRIFHVRNDKECER